jgi:hypothetical protein
MDVNDMLKKIPITNDECVLVFRRIILLFELAPPDDITFRLSDPRIQNYCKESELIIVPLNTISEVCEFCKNTMDFAKKYPSGFVVFCHNSQNQLRQLIHHMRNACSHAGIRIVKNRGKEYIEFKAQRDDKIKLLAQIPRDKFEKFWETLLCTLKFKSK